MRYLLRLCLAIIVLFIIGAAIGMFMPAVKSVERVIQIAAPADTVFPYLSDMDIFDVWSPWHSDAADYEYIVGGAERAVGQRAAWDCPNRDCQPGMQEILVVKPAEFVQAHLILDRYRADATYAILRDENFDDLVTVLIKVDLDVGGFPFIQRLIRFRRDRQLGGKLEAGLQQLKLAAEADEDLPD